MVLVPTSDLPITIRATAKRNRSLLRATRVFTYDVQLATGAEEHGVKLDDVLQGGRYPADA